MGNKRKKKRTYRRRCETTGEDSFGSKCVFCGSTDITRHHVVFQRFAPELDHVKSNHVPMCSRCQKVYHQLTDILLDYLKLNNQHIDNHEIRLPKPIFETPPPPTIPPTPVQTTSPSFTISGGQVSITFNWIWDHRVS